MLAAAAGHTEVPHFLCEHSPPTILRQDVRGRDAIMEASLNGHDTVVQILLTWAPGGAEDALAQADLDRNTALHFASSNGNLLVLRTLLASSCNDLFHNSFPVAITRPIWGAKQKDMASVLQEISPSCVVSGQENCLIVISYGQRK
ncbi:hypothetical protein B0T26DRAFT_772074 [Lasiosphaeria miniovina]|uniref:Uncharacterized protein n=1 Tax=Lasiosphaeria miniovina TaxID=1954250 RepID=A0AA40E0X7_9PEZI|nr:uncharacterized protein B0T26DRAFT_772074 [Lasiosphaeria miniovina]KAK0722930.1 hypothetical protein B0T26DRAFT_772074 [Lasiosphaeria miniovina]